jgi:hypothetical protein
MDDGMWFEPHYPARGGEDHSAGFDLRLLSIRLPGEKHPQERRPGPPHRPSLPSPDRPPSALET